MSPTGDERVRLAAGLGAALFAAHCLRSWPLDRALDDAWITFRVARNLVEAGIPTFDRSRPPVEGATSPLWTLISAGWVAAGLDPAGPARVLGAACGGGAVWLGGLSAARLTPPGGDPVRAALAAGLCLAACGGLAFHAAGGMETGLWVLLVAALLSACLDGRVGLAAALAPALVACRPEAPLVGIVACGLLARPERVGRWRWRARGRWRGLAASLVASLALITAWRLVTFHAPVPNTYFAKPPDPSAGVEYLVRWAAAGALPLALAAAALWREERSAERWGALALAAAALAAGVVWSGGDWMPGARRLLEVSWIAAVLAGAAAGRGRLGLAAAALWIAGQGVLAIRGEDCGSYYHQALADLGAELAADPAVGQVAATDIGRLGWHFPGAIYDLAGLTDAHIAGLAGGSMAKAWDEGYFRARAPDVVLITSSAPPGGEPVTVPVERDAWRAVQEGYALAETRQVARRGWLLIYRRQPDG
jgi:arabinofuranosyltransferase